MERKRKLELFENNNSDANQQQDGDQSGSVNPYTGRPYTKRYYDILKGRQGTFFLACRPFKSHHYLAFCFLALGRTVFIFLYMPWCCRFACLAGKERFHHHAQQPPNRHSCR